MLQESREGSVVWACAASSPRLEIEKFHSQEALAQKRGTQGQEGLSWTQNAILVTL